MVSVLVWFVGEYGVEWGVYFSLKVRSSSHTILGLG